MQPLKDDAIALLHALRANAACPSFIAMGRRLSILRSLEINGLVKDGALTHRGSLLAAKHPESNETKPEPIEQVQQTKAPSKSKKKKSKKHERREDDTGELDERKRDVDGRERVDVDDVPRPVLDEINQGQDWTSADGPGVDDVRETGY